MKCDDKPSYAIHIRPSDESPDLCDVSCNVVNLGYWYPVTDKPIDHMGALYAAAAHEQTLRLEPVYYVVIDDHVGPQD